MIGVDMAAGEMVNTIQQLVAGVNRHDVAAVIGLYADDAVVEDPVGTDPKIGHEAIQALYQQGFDLNIQFELTGPVRCAGNSAAFPFLPTIDLGENKMSIEIIELIEFNEDGKVKSMRAYWGPGNCVQN